MKGMNTMSEKGHIFGEKFVMKLENGELKKDFRTNHGDDFTGGSEALQMYYFRNYLYSCSTILMDERIKNTARRGYYG